MENLLPATREIMWNISNGWIIYVLFVVSLGIFGHGIYRHILLWKKGKPDNERFSELTGRFLFMIKEMLLQSKVRGSRFPAIFHSFIFYSFIALLITTVIILLDHDFGTSLFKGPVYLIFTLTSEIAGVLILVGILLAAKRRYMDKPQTLETEFADTLALILLSLIIITGFTAEGIRISATGEQYGLFSPIGVMTSSFFNALTQQQHSALHKTFWWLHAAMVLTWIAVLPYTTFFHLILIPANTFFSKMKPAGELSRVDYEALIQSENFDEENFSVGVDTVHDLTWKQRMDLDACVSCGRCEEICPAFNAEQPLSPKRFIAGMRELVHREDKACMESENGPEIVGNAFEEDMLWHCRTCMACVEVCPAFVEHVDTLIDLRRNEVNMKGRIPAGASRACNFMEHLSNPFKPQMERAEWIESLSVPIIGPGDECEVLYWIGCLTTFDPEKQKIALDIIELLKMCDVDFGLLGRGEICCGDPARVIGDENLFQSRAKQQVAELNIRKFKTLLTACPHCYTVLKNEYPQFGGHYHVEHHSQFFLEMIAKKKLLSKSNGTGKFVYHDPCYLGRYQKIYDEPREVIRSVTNGKLEEASNSLAKSFCCGGGGGHFWIDFKEGKRINDLRIQQLRESKADKVLTACPYCKHMLEDAVKMLNLDEQMQIEDISGLLARNCSSPSA